MNNTTSSGRWCGGGKEAAVITLICAITWKRTQSNGTAGRRSFNGMYELHGRIKRAVNQSHIFSQVLE